MVNKSKSTTNIEDDKEFAVEYSKVNKNCIINKITVNVRSYEPVSAEPALFQLKFYTESNGMIGDEIKNTTSFSKFLSSFKENFQLVFYVAPAIKISTEKPLFIGISLIRSDKIEKGNNKKTRLLIYSSKEKQTIMYMRSNDINYWIKDTFFTYDGIYKTLFPSIVVDTKCTDR